MPPDELAFPRVPGLSSLPAPHQAHRVDYGPRFRGQGIVDLQPPKVGRAFPVLVPQVDGDGNATSRNPGDLQGAAAAPVEIGATGVEIVIDEAL